MSRKNDMHAKLSSGGVKVLVTDEKSIRRNQTGTGTVTGRNRARDEGGYYDIVSFPDGHSKLKMSQYRVLEKR